MLRKRHQSKILYTACAFALVGIAFFGAYHGVRPNSASGHESPDHPDFLSREYFIEDPVAFWTLALAIATFSLFCITVWMARATDKVANQNVKTLIATERPYLTGGGGFTRRAGSSSAPRVFQVDVANYGNTPALLKHYDVQFTTKARVLQMPLLEVNRTYRHFDWIAPASGKQLKNIPFGDDIDVIYGSFWYLDFNRIEQKFRFILSVDWKTTYPDIADDVDANYTKWT
jgi:hypothetical protein